MQQDIRAHEAERDWQGEYSRTIKKMREDMEKTDQKLISINRAIEELSWDTETEPEDGEENAKLSRLRRDRE